MDAYLTPRDVSEKMKVSARTVANWLKNGMPHFKLGKTVRVSMHACCLAETDQPK